MPVEAATNCWTNAEDSLALALPELAAFRTLCGVADAEAAAAFVFWDEADEPDDKHAAPRSERERRVCTAVVFSAEEEGYEIALDADGTYAASGSLVLMLERLVAEEDWTNQETENISRGQVHRKTKNLVGDLLDQLAEYWWSHGGPLLGRVVVKGPWENHPDDWATNGRWHLVTVLIDWGREVE